jgi:hypothetical protein
MSESYRNIAKIKRLTNRNSGFNRSEDEFLHKMNEKNLPVGV